MHLIFRLSQWWYLHTIFQTQGGVWGDSAGPTLAIFNFLKKKGQERHASPHIRHYYNKHTTWIYTPSEKYTDLLPPTLTCTHPPSLVPTFLHLYSPSFTCTHFPSLVLTFLNSYSPSFTCTHPP